MAKYRITKINSINGNLRGVYGITLKSEKNTYCLNCNCFIRLDKSGIEDENHGWCNT